MRIGVLNLTDQDYRLNPLTLYNELPRGRTFAAGLQFRFWTAPALSVLAIPGYKPRRKALMDS